MTDTCTPDTLTPLPPVPPRPETDAAAVRAMNEILATVKPRPAAN
jgi:hypothetical protein